MPYRMNIYSDAELCFPQGGVSLPSGKRRPYVIFNMVASVDGKTTTRNGSLAGLSSPCDRHNMRRLRSRVDAILVGGNTLRHDPFVPILPPEMLGTRPQPKGVVVTQSGDLPLVHPFWQGERQHKLVFSQTPLPEVYQHKAIVRQFSGDLQTVLEDLFSEFGVRTILIEAGSSLNYQFIANGWADEFFLTISPVFVGGRDNLSILGGDRYGLGSSQLAKAELLSLYHHQNEVYLRYRFLQSVEH